MYLPKRKRFAYTARQTKEKCSDIDGDGIIEIPSTKEAGMQEKSLPLQPILTWSKWDGNSGVVFTTKSYTDDEGGFSLVFPSALNNQEVYVDVSVEAACIAQSFMRRARRSTCFLFLLLSKGHGSA